MRATRMNDGSLERDAGGGFGGARKAVGWGLAESLGDPASTGVLLCGTKPMAEGVKAWATGVGIAEEKCLTNF